MGPKPLHIALLREAAASLHGHVCTQPKCDAEDTCKQPVCGGNPYMLGKQLRDLPCPGELRLQAWRRPTAAWCQPTEWIYAISSCPR